MVKDVEEVEYTPSEASPVYTVVPSALEATS
jgi:hypothetical protein